MSLARPAAIAIAALHGFSGRKRRPDAPFGRSLRKELARKHEQTKNGEGKQTQQYPRAIAERNKKRDNGRARGCHESCHEEPAKERQMGPGVGMRESVLQLASLPRIQSLHAVIFPR